MERAPYIFEERRTTPIRDADQRRMPREDFYVDEDIQSRYEELKAEDAPAPWAEFLSGH